MSTGTTRLRTRITAEGLRGFCLGVDYLTQRRRARGLGLGTAKGAKR